MTSDVRVGVSIVLFQRVPPRLGSILDALAGQTHQAAAVAIRLNEGEPGALPALNALIASRGMPGLQVSSGPNTGFSGAHNAAMTTMFGSGLDAVVVHNPDLELESDALVLLADAHTRHRGMALLGPLLERADGDGTPTGRIDSAGIVWTRSARHLDGLAGEPLGAAPSGETSVDGLTGACVWVPRSVHEQVVQRMGEFFDEDFVAYREDADLGLVCASMGIAQLLVSAARGRHVRTQRGTVRGHDELIDRLGVRNRFLIAEKHRGHRPGTTPVAQLRDLAVIAGVVVRERSSLPGLQDAWRLRPKMRAKRAVLYGRR